MKKLSQMLIHHKTPAPEFFYLLLIFMVFTFSCSHLPRISETEIAEPKRILEKCQHVFPDSDWHFVHSIEATLSKKDKAYLLGITRISPQNQTIWAVMMTLEGMVLLDAFYDSNIIINRAIPPFDSKLFAQGLMEDISLIFFKPEHSDVETGLSDSGETICRYYGHNDRITDVVIEQNGNSIINSYQHNRLHRSIHLYGKEAQHHPFIFQRLELIALKPSKYRMDLNLLNAEPLTQ